MGLDDDDDDKNVLAALGPKQTEDAHPFSREHMRC